MGGISIWQLLIVLAIVILIFGTKKLKSIGGDLGGAIKNFKKSVSDKDDKGKENSDRIIEGEAHASNKESHKS